MTVTLTWCILLCALSFMFGALVQEFEDNRFEKALCENLKELKEIHNKIDEKELKE